MKYLKPYKLLENFQVGDEIYCISNDGTGLIIGGKYEVVGISDNGTSEYVKVKGDFTPNVFTKSFVYSNRFTQDQELVKKAVERSIQRRFDL